MECTATVGSVDYLLYRIGAVLLFVLWNDFYNLQRASRWVFLGFNAFVIFTGFCTHTVLALLLAPDSGTLCASERPVQMPQFDCFAAAFYLSISLANGLIFRTAYEFGWPRAVHVLVTVLIEPVALRPMVPATLAEMYGSVAIGAACGLALFGAMSGVLIGLADLYSLERKAERRKAVGLQSSP